MLRETSSFGELKLKLIDESNIIGLFFSFFLYFVFKIFAFLHLIYKSLRAKYIVVLPISYTKCTSVRDGSKHNWEIGYQQNESSVKFCVTEETLTWNTNFNKI